MFLFVSIAVVCLLIVLTPQIIKLINIWRRWNSPSNCPDLMQELELARAELERIRTTVSSAEEYTQLIKTMRVQKKINEIEMKLSKEKNMAQLKNASKDLIAVYAVKAILSLVLIIISIRNRYTPVMVFNERFNFQPLEGLLSFPTGVPNAISVPIWVLSCNVTFRLISNIIKGN